MEKELNLLSRINQENFESQTLMNHKGKSVVIFSADWCPYCVSFFNNWNEHSKVKDVFIADITDVESNLWDDFNIEVVPTMAVFENGVLVKRWDGRLRKGLTIDQIESVNNFLANS